MPDIRRLYDLQAVDLELDRRRARLAEIVARLGDESSLAGLRERDAALRAVVDEIGRRQHSLDDDIADHTEHINQEETKLYSGAVTSPRELSDLQQEVAQLGRHRAEREDRLLAVLDEMEAAQAQLDEASGELSSAQAAWDADQQSMAQEQTVLEAAVTEIASDRDARAAQVSPGELAVYDQVRRRHQGKAVARVRNGTCESCRVALPTRLAQSLHAAAAPVRCPSCSLILLAE